MDNVEDLKPTNLTKYPGTQLLEEDEVSKILNIAPGTLKNWRKQGKGPIYIKFGSVRYQYSDLLEFIKTSAIKPSSKPSSGGTL